MNATKVNSPPESGSEERGGVSRAQQHLKENDTIPLALQKAVLQANFTLQMKQINKKMLQTFH